MRMDWQGTDITAICTSIEALSAVEMAEQEDCICFSNDMHLMRQRAYPFPRCSSMTRVTRVTGVQLTHALRNSNLDIQQVDKIYKP